MVGLPYALWGVGSIPASPPTLNAIAPPTDHHPGWSPQEQPSWNLPPPLPKLTPSPWEASSSQLVLELKQMVHLSPADPRPMRSDPTRSSVPWSKGCTWPGCPYLKDRTLSFPCVRALGTTHFSLPTELSRDQHCLPHRAPQSCLLASKKGKENLKPTHRPSATQRLPPVPHLRFPGHQSHSAALHGMVPVPSPTPTDKTACEPGNGSRFRTSQLCMALEHESDSTSTQNSMFQGLQPTPKTLGQLVCQKRFWGSLDGNSTHFKSQSKLVQGRRAYYGPGPCHSSALTCGHRPKSKLPTALTGHLLPGGPLGRPQADLPGLKHGLEQHVQGLC